MDSPLDLRDVRLVQRQLEALRSEERSLLEQLASLRSDLAEAKQEFSTLRASQLLEANEHLVLAALRAQDQAETTASELDALTKTSQHDVLCGIPNRALMRDRLDKAIAMARRHSSQLALLFLDLDHFKKINDQLGHLAGDETLRQVARRLESVVRASDTISRHGGDEFLILLAEISHPGDASLMAARMLEAISRPLRLRADTLLQVSASIGVALYPDDGLDAVTLIARADAAMYSVKHHGRGGIELASKGLR